MTSLRSRSPLGRLLSLLMMAFVLGSLVGAEVAWAQGRPPVPGRHPVPTRPVSKDDAAPAAKKVEVDVMVVYANNAGDRVDPALESVMQQLRFTRFKSFTKLESHGSDLDMGQESAFNIPGGRRVKIQLLSRDEQQAKIRVRMFNSGSKLLDTTVSIHRNRSFMVAGPKYEEGVLILPITVRY